MIDPASFFLGCLFVALICAGALFMLDRKEKSEDDYWSHIRVPRSVVDKFEKENQVYYTGSIDGDIEKAERVAKEEARKAIIKEKEENSHDDNN